MEDFADCLFQAKKPCLPSKFFVRNYLEGFANDPVLKIDNIGKVTGGKAPASQEVKQEGQGDVSVSDEGKSEEAAGAGDDNSDENGDAVLLEKPRWENNTARSSVSNAIVAKLLCWPFARVQGFWENVWQFIPHLHVFVIFEKQWRFSCAH